MKTRNIEHKILFRATPQAIYNALMNQKQHAQFTGERAPIRAKAGVPFSGGGRHITGITLDLKPGKRIVHAWRSQNRPDGHCSIAAFALAAESGGTRLRLTQIGVPSNDYEWKNNGWRMPYRQPLKEFLEK